MLLQFDPFRDLDRRDLDRGWGPRRARSFAMPMDAVRNGDDVYIYLDLPGVDRDSIDIEVERNVLTVQAERRWTPGEDDRVLSSERSQGEFSRRIILGETLDTDALSAGYEDGVLKLHLPVREAAKPRKVEVHTSNKELEADVA